MCSSQMKQQAEWYDTCLAVTRVFAANVYWCWWAPLHSCSKAQLFWSLVLLFLSPLPCFLSPCHIKSGLRDGGRTLRYLLIEHEESVGDESNHVDQAAGSAPKISGGTQHFRLKESYLGVCIIYLLVKKIPTNLIMAFSISSHFGW